MSNDEQLFDQLLANCDREPIQIPGAIQPHGVLLVINEASWQVAQLSANADVLLASPAERLAGLSIEQVLGETGAGQVREAATLESLDEVNPLSVTLGGGQVDCIMHRHDGLLLLEFEHPDELPFDNAPLLDRGLGRALTRLQGARTLADLYRISVAEIQKLTGYDRVLIYRFEQEGHGQVIAEASGPDMALYNGLFFPASDIPAQARELYRINWLRIIPDSSYVPVPLVPLLRPDTGKPLDLTHAYLRSVSPIHCQYMKNMGVASSMSISLLKQDRLWGLISCGNRTPMTVPHALRAACQAIGQVLSMQITALQEIEAQAQRDAKQAMLLELAQIMRAADDQDVLEALCEPAQQLMALVDASGVAVLVGDRLHLAGHCPSPEQVAAIYQWVRTQASGVVETSSLGTELPEARGFSEVASGLLSLTLPKPVDNAVMWFRPELKQSVNWSGDPRKVAAPATDEPGSRAQLQPRKSFELWQEQVDGKARRWDSGDLFAATDLRRSALEVDLARQVLKEQEAVRARDELVAVVSHDLRSPLTVIVMQCGMMQRLLAGEAGQSSKRIGSAIETLQRATSRMTNLLEDLLDTAKIEAGRYSISPHVLEVSQIFEENYSLLAPLALNKQIDLRFATEPDLLIMADPERLFQVLSNLVGNAIKFTPKEGSVAISAVRDGAFVRVSITDSGRGISPEQLPHVFERYWRVREGNPNGTGLGLYICMGIVKAHGGELHVTSEPEQGSEFIFTIPLAGTAPAFCD
jgi:chemotaxis family two-component system sensor kinase Cph1